MQTVKVDCSSNQVQLAKEHAMKDIFGKRFTVRMRDMIDLQDVVSVNNGSQWIELIDKNGDTIFVNPDNVIMMKVHNDDSSDGQG